MAGKAYMFFYCGASQEEIEREIEKAKEQIAPFNNLETILTKWTNPFIVNQLSSSVFNCWFTI